MLQTFEAPNGAMSGVRRARSSTPLQALTTLNEPLFLEPARALAMRVIEEGGDTDTQRLTYAMRRCVARGPTEQEASQLLALLNKQTQRFAGGKLNPWDLAAASPEQPPAPPKGATPAQLAA